MSGWSYGPGEARAVQVLARHQMIARLLADVAQDMTICKLEGWDVWEYPRMLFEAIPVPPAEVALDDGEDSWKRIEEDAGCTATKYNERRGTIFTTKQQVARDLVRRCKALAERGE